MAENENPTATTAIQPNGPGAGPQIVVQGRESMIVGMAEKAMGLTPGRMIAFAILSCCIMLVGTFCYVLWDGRGKLIELVAKTTADKVEADRTRSHSTALTDFVVRDRQYKSLLASTRTDINASRAILFSYHNGTESLNGRLPFLFSSALSEDSAPGISHELERFQRVPLEASSGIVQEFIKGNCIRRDVDTAPTNIADTMRSVGTVVSFACPIFAEVGQEPSGYVAVSYQTNWPVPSTDTVHARLRTTATALGAIQAAYMDNLRRR